MFSIISQQARRTARRADEPVVRLAVRPLRLVPAVPLIRPLIVIRPGAASPQDLLSSSTFCSGPRHLSVLRITLPSCSVERRPPREGTQHWNPGWKGSHVVIAGSCGVVMSQSPPQQLHPNDALLTTKEKTKEEKKKKKNPETGTSPPSAKRKHRVMAYTATRSVRRFTNQVRSMTWTREAPLSTQQLYSRFGPN